jgi:hypothetical protein
VTRRAREAPEQDRGIGAHRRESGSPNRWCKAADRRVARPPSPAQRRPVLAPVVGAKLIEFACKIVLTTGRHSGTSSARSQVRATRVSVSSSRGPSAPVGSRTGPRRPAPFLSAAGALPGFLRAGPREPRQASSRARQRRHRSRAALHASVAREHGETHARVFVALRRLSFLHRASASEHARESSARSVTRESSLTE